VGPRNDVLDGIKIPPAGKGNFWELSGPLQSIGSLRRHINAFFIEISIMSVPTLDLDSIYGR